jgi:glycosyltransferase involved in cell wall biosynthesis
MGGVVHVSPMFFGEGYVGGGERYPLELALAMAGKVETRLVSFGRRFRRLRHGPLRIHVLPIRGHWKGHDVNPLSELFPLEIAGADAIHAHHYESIVTDQCLLVGRAAGSGVFVTDHGGRGPHPGRRLHLERLMTRFLAVSRYSAESYPELLDRTTVINAGVDVQRFRPDGADRLRTALFVGRLIPFKGLDYAVRAADERLPLDLIGPSYDRDYRRVLERLADGKPVRFHPPPAPEQLQEAYRRARVFVLPSVYESEHAPRGWSELFPLVVLEAMASGTPVVATRVGGNAEIVTDGVNGFLVGPNDAEELRDRILTLLDDDALWKRMSIGARETVVGRYTWDKVADRALAAYAR